MGPILLGFLLLAAFMFKAFTRRNMHEAIDKRARRDDLRSGRWWASFPENRWVRIRVGEVSFIGFTYVENVEDGPCFRGGLEGIDRRLADDPTVTLAPMPWPCPLEILTAAEIAKHRLPAEPSWWTSSPEAIAVIERALDIATVAKLAGLRVEGDLTIEQDPKFPANRWVRTTLFDGKTPYIGFTYTDKTKGNCIKGEDVKGMSEADIKTKLRAKFPSSTMQTIPAGHAVTPLTAAEIATYELPAEPDWVKYYR